MRILGLAVVVLFLAGCSKKDETPEVDTTQAVPVAAAPAPISLADMAGTWDVSVLNEAGDSTLTTYVLTAAPDTTTWTMMFAGHKDPVTAHVIGVAGDSVTIHAGPYSSALRKNVKVNTQAIYRLVDGKLVGKAVAHYDVKTADSVRTLNLTGTKR